LSAPFKMDRVSRHTLVYGAGIVLGRAVSVVMLPIYTRFLAPADYGVMQLVDMTLEVISIFAGSRLAGGIFKYYHEADDQTGKTAVLSTAMILLVTSFGAFGTATALAAAPVSQLVFGSPEYAGLIRLAAASFAVSSLVTAPLVLLRLEERSVRYTYVTTARLVLQLTLNIVFLVVLRLGVKSIFMSTLISNVVLGVWLGVPFVRRVGLVFSRPFAKRLLRYGMPLVANHVALFITTFGDRYFLRVSGTTTDVGLYALAYQFGFLLLTLGYTPFAMMWEPMRFEVAKRPDRDAVFGRAFVAMNLLLLTTAVGIGLFVNDFIRVMADPAYRSAAGLVPIILVAYVLQGWAAFVEVGALVRERTEFVALANWLACATALIAYALLIPHWLGLGAAIATLLASVVRLVVSQVASQRLFPIRLHWGPVWRVAMVATAVWLASRAIPHQNVVTSLALRTALFGIFGMVVWFGKIVPPSDREHVRSLISWRRFFGRAAPPTA
jgi:O-antigen/teichoic acid export membrane protein